MRMAKKQDKGKNRILLTGGHAATTALATVEELIRDQKWEIFWVGAKSAIEGKNIPTLESEIFPKIGIQSYKIISGRIQRKLTLWTLPSLLKIPLGFIHAIILLLKIRPKVILSFGGFASFPIVAVGFLFGIPIVLHEQTSAAGRASRASAVFAKKIALSRKSSLKYFPGKKCEIVGNPIMTQIAEIKSKKIIGNPPTVFVVGGSRGSQTINLAIISALKNLLSKYNVIHQTGYLDYDKTNKMKKTLPKDLRDKYEIYPVIDPMDIDGVYRRADIVVARAGANTVAEILAINIPSILIPIPWSYNNEQMLNAEYAQEHGPITIIEQEDLSGETLLKVIDDSIENWEKLVRKSSNRESIDLKAANKLVKLLEGLI